MAVINYVVCMYDIFKINTHYFEVISLRKLLRWDFGIYGKYRFNFIRNHLIMFQSGLHHCACPVMTCEALRLAA